MATFQTSPDQPGVGATYQQARTTQWWRQYSAATTGDK